jgi:tetratricopeptide (TPR) repeat protein
LDRLNVFISSRTKELHDERLFVKTAITDLLNDFVYVFIFEEDSVATTDSPEIVYSDKVRKCDIYIGIFREEYSEPTEKEYLIAIENEKVILIFVSSYDIKKRDEKLQILLKELEKHNYKTFENIMNLRTQVLRSIANYLVTSLPSKNIFKNMSVRNNIIEFSKESIDAIPKQVKTNPLDADAWYFRGNTLGHMGRSDEAIESYDKATRAREKSKQKSSRDN